MISSFVLSFIRLWPILSRVPVKSCSVSFLDTRGIRHACDVEAESLYEAGRQSRGPISGGPMDGAGRSGDCPGHRNPRASHQALDFVAASRALVGWRDDESE